MIIAGTIHQEVRPFSGWGGERHWLAVVCDGDGEK